jgi:hypothetical protein
MKSRSIACAFIALVTALIAAWHWYRSSKVGIDPGWSVPGAGGHIEPVDPARRQLDLDAATITAFHESAMLNKIASLWTAVSLLAAAGSSILGPLA